jgi:hypothetical protein
MEIVMKLINELVSTSKSLKFLLIVAAIMISLSSSINAANIRPKYDDEDQSSSSTLTTTNNEPTNVDIAAANSNHNNKLNTQLQLVRLVNLLRALESDPSFYRNYVEQKAAQYYNNANSADDVDDDEDDDRKLSAELNELYQDYSSDSNGPEQTPSTIIKKILPDTHRSKRLVTYKIENTLIKFTMC